MARNLQESHLAYQSPIVHSLTAKILFMNLFWNHVERKLIGYYVNFQHPFRRTYCGIAPLDLELDIDPDLSFRCKDMGDYQKAIDYELVPQEYIQGVEAAEPEILERTEKRRYPFDGSWLNWMPGPEWSPPALPEHWDKI